MIVRVGLLVIVTRRYHEFLAPLLESADRNFLPGTDVSYQVFTDRELDVRSSRSIIAHPVEHRPWPFMTLGRYGIFHSHRRSLSALDYLYYCDVDMIFESAVGQEIISDRVVVQHPGYHGRRGTPETNPASLACVHPWEQMQYFAGGFNGGSAGCFLEMCGVLSGRIDRDLENGVIAVWHDESHLNRYMIDNPPTKVLDPSYCCNDGWHDCPFGRRIVALTKKNPESYKNAH